MARAEYIFETNSVNGGFLVDRRTDQIVGTTSRGVDRYFVNGETNQLTGVVINKIWTGTQAQYDAIVTKDASTLYVIVG